MFLSLDSRCPDGQQEKARRKEKARSVDADGQEGWEAVLSLPTTLYKIPGPHSGNGFKYDYAGADTQAAYDALKAAGWSDTLPEALKPASVEPAAPADDAPPTRAELEAKADDLGVKYDGRTGDALLLTRINAALGV